ncbi:MAG: ferric enterobactin receptor [Flavobacteriales bacterium]|jgi:ferric enterobactin receptor
MKRILLIALILPFFMHSQERGGGNFKGFGKDNSKDYIKGNISGKIVDSKTGENLDYASISLTNTDWGKVIEGTISDSKGRFYINKIRSGKYQISISYLGYDIQNIDFELNKKKPDIKLEDILLVANTEMLSEVKISEQKPIFESKIDKIVYNAENDMNEGLNDATDVLRKAPLLTVDLEGEVSLRGSKNIKFLVNGKASTFFSSDIATALQMIPADEIKSVEIITSPGAKYDGEGDAGIVNIITKRKVIDGYKSTFSGSFGNRMNKQSGNISLGKGRFGISARASTRYSWPRKGESNKVRRDWELDNNGDTIGLNTLDQMSNTFGNWVGTGGSVNMYYDINAYNSIMSDIRFGSRGSFSDDNSTTNDNDSIYKSYLETSRKSKNIEWSTDYTKTFSNDDKKEFNISLQIGGDLGDDNINSSREKINQYSTSNDEKEIEITLQTDYTHPFMKENKLEIGAKLINRDREIVSTTTSEFTEYSSPQFILKYIQQVISSYISSDWSFNNDIGLKTGVRYEYTIINVDSKGNKYGNILPNITISKNFSKTKSLKLSYNNRILRPGIQNINPNEIKINDFTTTLGNPNLIPANTKQIEIGYNQFGRKYQGSYNLYIKKTNDIIESYSSISEYSRITINSYENIGSSTNYGFNYFGSLRFDKFNIRTGFNLYQYNGTGEINNQKISLTSSLLYSYNFGGSYNISDHWKAECWGFFRSPNQTIQGSSTSFSMMSFGVKKEFKNKRGSLGIRIIEPFKDKKIFLTEINGENFTQRSERIITFRSIGISFKYTFGKLNFKSSKKQSGIKNDDVNESDNADY